MYRPCRYSDHWSDESTWCSPRYYRLWNRIGKIRWLMNLSRWSATANVELGAPTRPEGLLLIT